MHSLAQPPSRPWRHQEITAFVGMVVFLGAWAMMFAALFFSYFEIRVQAMSWPPPGENALPLVLPALNTVLLVATSAFLWVSYRSARRTAVGAYRPWTSRGLLLALLLGSAFLTLQLTMWRRLYLGGLRPDSGIFGSVFYTLTVFHALHVFVGLVALLVLWLRARHGRYHDEHNTALRLWGMYFHFVDVVWVLMFFTVYVF